MYYDPKISTYAHAYSGTFAVVELMIGNSIQRVLGSNNETEHCLNSTFYQEDSEFCDGVMVPVAITIAFLSGVLMVGSLYIVIDSALYMCVVHN